MKRMFSFHPSQSGVDHTSNTTLRNRYGSKRMIGHRCELTGPNEQEQELVAPLSLWGRIKDSLLRSILVSGDHPMSIIYLRSSAAVSCAAEDQIESKNWYIIHPFSNVRWFWTIFMFIVLLIYLFLMPFLVVFSREKWNYKFFMSVDFVCLLDIIMNFMSGYLDTNTKSIILDPWLIARRYLKCYFWIDLFSSIPYKFILLDIGPYQDNYGVKVATSVLTFIKILRVRALLSNFWDIAEYLAIKESVIPVMTLAIVYTMTVHWAACMHYWVPYMIHSSAVENVPDSWLNQRHILREEATLWTKYMLSLFRATSNIMLLGFGQDYPKTIEDSIVSMLSIASGAFLNSYLIGVILHCFASVTAAETKHYQTKIQLMEYMRYKKMPQLLQKRMLLFFENKYQKGYFREAVILSTLNEFLREEISLYRCRRLLLDVALFHNLPKEVVTAIVSKLEYEVCLPNDTIIKAGTPGDCMYFLATGTASVTTPTGKEVCHYEDGAHFGEIGIVDDKQTRRSANVIAVDICELYRLTRTDFEHSIQAYPELYGRIKEIAMERKTNIQAVETEYRKDLLSRSVAQKKE